jgi:very-short-patch-repair endonuclease
MSPDRKNLISPSVRNRSKQLRRAQTPAEKTLWRALKNRQLGGFKFRRQHPIGKYIVDFYCAKAKLVIELDGGSHKNQMENDTNRTAWLESRGYQVLRFPNHQIKTNLDLLTTKILQVCDQPEIKTS